MPLDIGGTVLNNIQSYNLANYSVPTSGLQVFLTTKLTESYPEEIDVRVLRLTMLVLQILVDILSF